MIRYLCIHACLFILALASAAGAQRITFSNGKSSVRVPFDLSGREVDNHIYLQVSLNGSGPLRFILDTGANHSFLALRTAQRLGLTLTDVGKLTGGIGDDLPRVWVVGEPLTVELPGLKLLDRRMAAVNIDGAEKCINKAASKAGVEPRTLDGVLGADVFNDLVVSIDYQHKLIDLIDPASFQDDGKGRTIKLTFDRNTGYILARIEVKGKSGEPTEVEVIVDTGAGDTLSLNPMIWKPRKLAPPADAISLINDCGVGGEQAEPTLLGNLAWMKFGDMTFKNHQTRFIQTKMDPAYHDGILGNGILRNFSVVTFDYHNSRMIVKK